jgi:class 3 adenylate cyclase
MEHMAQPASAITPCLPLPAPADMLASARMVAMPHTGLPTTVRVGLHTGPCTSGLVGSRLPKFSLFGDSMNTASRMESTCPIGRIQVSETTHALLQSEQWEATGGIEVKGKVCDRVLPLWHTWLRAKHP